MNKQELFDQLVKHLSQLVLVYRHLLDAVRKEKQILLKAELAALQESNKSKEKMLKKISDLEKDWMNVATQIHALMGRDTGEPRLSEIATHFDGIQRDKLLQLRSVLNLLVQRTSAVNRQNESLTQSALSHISGAMKAIKDTLNKNSNYEKKGTRSEPSTKTSGRLMSKEV